MSIGLVLSSGRLILRPLQIEDALEIYMYRSNANANQFQGWIPSDLSDVKDFILTRISPEINIPDTWFQMAMVERESNKIIGDIGIHFLKSDNSAVELGITLNQDFHGNGFASEALTAIITHLFSKLNKQHVFATIDPNNGSSIRLFERLGFRRQGLIEIDMVRSEWPDDLVFGIDHNNWV